MSRLTVSGGDLYLDGEYCDEIGYNAYSLGQKAWLSAEYDYRTDFTLLAANGVKVVRIMCAPFQGSDWNALIGNPIPANWAAVPATYRNIMEDLFDKAADSGIAIVACLHWNYQCIPDMLSETYANAFLAGSNSITYWKAWATLFVNQFKNHAALGMWQIGNEWPMFQITEYGGAAPYSGHNASRVRSVVSEIATSIRAADASTPIASGSIGAPMFFLSNRPSTRAAADNIVAWCPSPCNVAEAHLYLNNAFVGSGWNGTIHTTADSIRELTAAYKRRAAEVGKAFMVGEIGVSGDQDSGTDLFKEILGGVRGGGAQLSLVWNWNEEGSGQDEWNIYPGYEYSSYARGDNYITAVKHGSAFGYERDWTTLLSPPQLHYASFTGASGGEISIPASSSYNTTTMSFACWVRSKAPTSFSRIAQYRSADNTKGWVVLFDTNGMLPFVDFRKGGPASANNSAGIVGNYAKGEWVHLAYSFTNPTGSTFERRIWLNGFEFHYLTGADSGYVPHDGTVALYLASSNGGSYGNIDLADVCLSDEMWSTPDVMNLMKYGTEPPGVLGRWRLNGNANDDYGNHGTAGGGVSYAAVAPSMRTVTTRSQATRTVSNRPTAQRQVAA